MLIDAYIDLQIIYKNTLEKKMNLVQYTKDLFHQPYFISFLAIITCLCFYYLKSENKTCKKIIWIAYFSIFVTTLSIFIVNAIYRIYHPEVWDFTAFYLYGKVAVLGYNFYLPENFQNILNSINLPFSVFVDFIDEVVNVGFPYPPPTIFYFLPLGFFSFKTALIVWTIFNIIFVFGCIYLIFDLFFKTYKINEVFLISILFFIFLPSLSTINLSQTNFILLFLLLLMKKYSNKSFSGIFLALAFFTKPYMGIFILFYLLLKKWKTIMYFIASILVIVGLTIVTFGKEIFISYLFNNPSRRLPKSVFSEDINQSLLSVLLRNNLISLDYSQIYIYIAIGFFFITVVYLYFLYKRKLNDSIWVVLLMVGLIIYPGTLSHYGTLLLFVIFQFFDEKKQLGFKPYILIPIIGTFYYFSTVSVFTAICFLLSVVVLKSIISIHQNNFATEDNLQKQYH